MNKLISWILGIVSHALFVVAITLMAYMLATGLTQSIFPIGGEFGRFFNLILILQFPIFHSLLLTQKGKYLLTFFLPKAIGQDLVTTVYALISSIQLICVFIFWTPGSEIWFEPKNLWYTLSLLLYGLSWLLLVRSLSEAGMAMHTGWIGWRAVVTGKKVKYPAVPVDGLHSECRHPIYLSFSLIIITAPVWSFDHFILAILWVLYCLIGPKFKEQRIQKKIGLVAFDKIKMTIPYIIPRSLNLRSIVRIFKKLVFK